MTPAQAAALGGLIVGSAAWTATPIPPSESAPPHTIYSFTPADHEVGGGTLQIAYRAVFPFPEVLKHSFLTFDVYYNREGGVLTVSSTNSYVAGDDLAPEDVNIFADGTLLRVDITASAAFDVCVATYTWLQTRNPLP